MGVFCERVGGGDVARRGEGGLEAHVLNVRVFDISGQVNVIRCVCVV